MRAATEAAKRLVLEVLGWSLLLVGFLALFLPGPGLLLTVAGLAVLSTQYGWAKRMTEPVKVHAWRAAAEGVENWMRITLSTLGALTAGAFGALWIWSPTPPSWWMLPPTWWLFGGPAVGITLIGSSLLALGLLAYSVHRFHDRPEAVAEVKRNERAYRAKVARRRRAHLRLNRMRGARDRVWHGRV
ncbi:MULTISPECIES: PGPGW domain-containing protein [unclassified Ornithinimicrobium]|uniref:PGPGW domain-containing protein n=1 Tax=unclassified Ornithinimicrobium TaxID=2615080 RepID=UPI003854A8C1